jgi:hypothetical protein
MENILLIRLKSIGDVLFTLPAVNAVRAHYPGAKITFLTSRENAPLLAGFRAVDEIMALDRTQFQHGGPGQILTAFVQLLRRLRREPFTLAFDFQGFGETQWLALSTSPAGAGCILEAPAAAPMRIPWNGIWASCARPDWTPAGRLMTMPCPRRTWAGRGIVFWPTAWTPASPLSSSTPSPAARVKTGPWPASLSWPGGGDPGDCRLFLAAGQPMPAPWRPPAPPDSW